MLSGNSTKKLKYLMIELIRRFSLTCLSWVGGQTIK
jgi:hypothetical protein